MFYYWLIPLVIVALIAIGVFSYAGDKKAKLRGPDQSKSPEPIRRGRFLNK